MFDMGLGEILLIAIVAILFLGPDKLPDAMVKIAKFFKSVKKAVGDAKSALDEEMKIAELKEEAMSYKKQLDAATNELQGFKNIGINPMNDIKEAVNDAKKTLTEAGDKTKPLATAVPIEPKRETITFEKKKQESAIPLDDRGENA